MAQKNNPQDSEIRDRFLTTRDNLPADQLHAKRLQILELEHLKFLRLARDVIPDGHAKEAMLDKFEIAHTAMRYAIENPGLAAPEVVGVAGDELPFHRLDYPAVPAFMYDGQDPPAGTGLGPFNVEGQSDVVVVSQPGGPEQRQQQVAQPCPQTPPADGPGQAPPEGAPGD